MTTVRVTMIVNSVFGERPPRCRMRHLNPATARGMSLDDGGQRFPAEPFPLCSEPLPRANCATAMVLCDRWWWPCAVLTGGTNAPIRLAG